jgi:release factor glutamine methyltransferase
LTAECVGLDVSSDAVALSRLNARELGLSGRYEAVLEPQGIAAFSRQPFPVSTAAAVGITRGFDLVVSNAPYIPSADMATLPPEVQNFEDERVLCGGHDGLDVIRHVIRAAPNLLRPGGTGTVWLEVDTSHPPLLQSWLQQSAARGLGVGMVRWLPDLSGRPRFCELRWDGVGVGDGT